MRRLELSQVETATLALVARGMTDKQIAKERGRSIHTVKDTVANACMKLGVSRRAEAVAVAVRAGVI